MGGKSEGREGRERGGRGKSDDVRERESKQTPQKLKRISHYPITFACSPAPLPLFSFTVALITEPLSPYPLGLKRLMED